MSLIEKVAYLLICTCGVHAQIVFSNRKRSKNFGSKERGRKLLALALEEGLITIEEMKVVMEMIDRSPLVEESGVVDRIIEELHPYLRDVGIEELQMPFGNCPPQDVVQNN